MRSYLTGSIVFRLWAALSIIATVFTTVSLVTYTWLAIDANISSAQNEIDTKIQVAFVRMARVGNVVEPPSEREITTAGELGISRIDLFTPDGVQTASVGFQSVPVAGSTIGIDEVREGVARHTVRIDGSRLIKSRVSPLQVLQGGRFGEERVSEVPSLPTGGPGYLRAVVQYPDLTSAAQAQVWRSIGAGVLIIGAIMAGMWPLLNNLVSRPLRRYSELALRIAAGEPVRMPVHERGELGDLGRAVNAMAETLEHEATVDPLTGLYNLRHLGANLEGIIAATLARGDQLSLIIADMDNLKPVNDSLGHQAGDQILKAVGDGLSDWGKGRYTCWRLGGDEFVLVLPGVGPERAARCAEELRGIVAGMIVSIRNTLVRPSISVGVANCPADGITAGDLIAVADRRMYQEKTRRAEEKRLQLVVGQQESRTSA